MIQAGYILLKLLSTLCEYRINKELFQQLLTIQMGYVVTWKSKPYKFFKVIQ